MDIVNIFTAITWACVGSSLVSFVFPNHMMYFTTYGILFYYTFQKTKEMDSKYIKYGNRHSGI